MGVDVFERLGPISGRAQPQKKNVFERLGPVSGRVRKSQPQKANVFHRLGPVSGNVHSSKPQKPVNVYQRLGPNSNKVQKKQPKKSAPVSGVFQSSRPLVDYSGVHDSQPQNKAVVEKKEHKKEGVGKSEEKRRILPTTSPCFSSLAQLEGHQSAITGIAFPAGSDKLLTGSKDKTVRIWDCKSGNCLTTIALDGEVGCMNCEGPCVFVGTTNSIKIWNTQKSEEYTLAKSSSEQVHAIAMVGDRLFAGVQGGKILSWQFDATTSSFKPAASLIGHTSSVVSLAAGPNSLLYSGSADKTIRIWNAETLECQQILTGHYNSVTSLIAADNIIVSCSLDGTIKVWAKENEKFEVKVTQTEEWGLQSMCWTGDLEGKPVLLCSSDDNTVRAYDIPSFAERGRIYSEEEVLSIRSGPPGMFITGDAAGHVNVWKWSSAPEATK